MLTLAYIVKYTVRHQIQKSIILMMTALITAVQESNLVICQERI